MTSTSNDPRPQGKSNGEQRLEPSEAPTKESLPTLLNPRESITIAGGAVADLNLATPIGTVRAKTFGDKSVEGRINEDGIHINQGANGKLTLTVIDGMGGLGGGATAAKITADRYDEGLKQGESVDEIQQSLQPKFLAENAAGRAPATMGVAVGSIEIAPGEAPTVTHAGDVKILIVRPGEEPQLVFQSFDHDSAGYGVRHGIINDSQARYSAEQIADAMEQGNLDEEQAKLIRKRNGIYCSANIQEGSAEEFENETNTLAEPLQKGDIVLVLGDGVTDNVPVSALIKKASRLADDPDALVDEILKSVDKQLTWQAGKSDDTTLAVVRIEKDVPIVDSIESEDVVSTANLRDEFLRHQASPDREILEAVELAAKQSKESFVPGTKTFEEFQRGLIGILEYADEFEGDLELIVEAVREQEVKLFGAESPGWDEVLSKYDPESLDNQDAIAEIAGRINTVFHGFSERVENIAAVAESEQELSGLYNEAVELRESIYEPFIGRLGGRGPCPNFRDGIQVFDKKLRRTLREKANGEVAISKAS